MRLTVFGASGRTGRELVRQATDAGHDVIAVVRDPARLPIGLTSRVQVAQSDLRDAAALEKTVKGRDAVISAIGANEPRDPASVCTDTAGAIITAMRATGGDLRLVTASNSAMAPGPGDDPFTRYVVKPLILARLLRHMIDDMRRAEQIVRASGLPWTIVRAGRLTDRPGKDSYRSAMDRNVLGGFQITRADFATALLDAATTPTSAGHVISVSG
jgi:putative NADH-flavin reductase